MSTKGAESAQKALRWQGPARRKEQGNRCELIQVMTFLAPSNLPALANEGLYELTQRPSLTRAVLLSSAETTENLAVVR